MSKKAIKIMVVMLFPIMGMYQSAEAQTSCSGNKFRMVKGSFRCGCYCQKKCVAAQDTAAYKANYWYFGTDCWGSCCWIRAGADPSIETSLTEIYPNPASGEVTIAFTLSQPGEVALDVFDMTGRYVTSVSRKVFEEAGNVLTWDVSALNPGIYFLEMKAGSYSSMKKLSVIK